MPPLSVLDMAKLFVKHRKESTREAMKREGRKVGKGDMLAWLQKTIGSAWAHRVGFFPVTDDWYPSWIFPDGQYVKAIIDDGYGGAYVSVRLYGHDDHSVEYIFQTLIEAEAFWDQLSAEPELCHTMISLLYEPFAIRVK